MKNLYKDTQIFRCIHESHQHFQHKISVYHILKEKACYPQGCIYFRWRCKQLNKKKTCHRGYSHVGRKCSGCRDFYEEKIHNYPELQIGEKEYRQFKSELELFEDWIEEHQNKPVEFSGKITNVKPHFVKKEYPKTSFLSFKGFILVMKDIYLDRLHFEDSVYGLISAEYLKRLNSGPDSEIEGQAYLKVDQGRLILSRFRRLEILQTGKPLIWTETATQLIRNTATEFSVQPEGCLQCPFGALLEVEYYKDHHSHSRRKLYCLQGMADFRNCYVRADYCGLDREADDLPQEQCKFASGIKISSGL